MNASSGNHLETLISTFKTSTSFLCCQPVLGLREMTFPTYLFSSTTNTSY